MDDPPVWGLGEGLTTPHRKTLIFYGKEHRILRGIVLSDRGYYCKLTPAFFTVSQCILIHWGLG